MPAVVGEGEGKNVSSYPRALFSLFTISKLRSTVVGEKEDGEGGGREKSKEKHRRREEKKAKASLSVDGW